MEFNEKLQELRKQNGLTQEELANALFVSRTAVSKWESGRGYPNIDTIKNIAKFFNITVDELLSGGELLNIAENDSKQKQNYFRDLVFGLLDISTAIFFFVPFFAERSETIKAVNLSALTVLPYLKITYFILIFAIILFGILTLALQAFENKFKLKNIISIILSAVLLVLLILSLQPYAAILAFVFVLIKALILKVSRT